jgi:hypothetical protein
MDNIKMTLSDPKSVIQNNEAAINPQNQSNERRNFLKGGVKAASLVAVASASPMV